MMNTRLMAGLLTGCVAAAMAANTGKLQIVAAVDQPSEEGPADFFTGKARIVGRFKRDAPARVTGAVVTFMPGAYTIWHSHPLGQTLIVTEGSGYVQVQGEPIRKLAKGDTAWTPPGVMHWHGAMSDTSMTHVAIAEALDGQNVERGARVTPAEYAAAVTPALGCSRSVPFC
jgi:quercetin dioxygenase-like cupin family protein